MLCVHFLFALRMTLSRDILATISYYDVMDQPLTAFEVWKHLIVSEQVAERPAPVPLSSVYVALDGKELRGRISCRNGFFVLPNRDVLIAERIRSEKVAVAKLARVRRLVRWLRFVPFIRMIGITGSLAMKKGTRESDWDFFVVTGVKRIFVGRTALTGILHLIRRRRHGRHTRDRVCLNYFVTDGSLRIPTEDLYSANEYMQLIPVIGRETYRRFEVRNRWIAGLKPDFRPTELMPAWYVPDSGISSFVRSALERLLDSEGLESWLGRWQTAKIMRNPKTATEGSRIEATEQALVFLPRPHGPIVFEKFRKRFGEVRMG